MKIPSYRIHSTLTYYSRRLSTKQADPLFAPRAHRAAAGTPALSLDGKRLSIIKWMTDNIIDKLNRYGTIGRSQKRPVEASPSAKDALTEHFVYREVKADGEHKTRRVTADGSKRTIVAWFDRKKPPGSAG